MIFSKYIRKKICNRSVLLRKKSTDSEVYDYVFGAKYHRLYKELKTEAPIILDLGTNIGLTIVDFKLTHPRSTVYGFEMDAENYELALKNCVGLEQVRIENKAIWHEKSRLSYSKAANDDAFKLSAVKTPQTDDIEVETVSINDIVAENRLSEIHYIKMDIEGAEKEVLANNLEWLQITQQIKIEVHFDQSIFRILEDQLKSHGFHTLKDTHHWSTLIGYR